MCLTIITVLFLAVVIGSYKYDVYRDKQIYDSQTTKYKDPET